ncbi:MAG: hypothetical protein M1826_007687 [Phylliscum demangeonii]|nr:MAG: hypothetical protein M1826_007687 [Phylliscum demangeonii]
MYLTPIVALVATIIRLSYLTPQPAVRVEPTRVTHLPPSFCGLFGVAPVGDDDTGALREAFDKPRPSLTIAPMPTASIPPAGPSSSSDDGREPVEEEGSAAPVVPERSKTTVTVIIRPDTPTITIQFADIAVKVIVEQLVAPAKPRTSAGLRPARGLACAMALGLPCCRPGTDVVGAAPRPRPGKVLLRSAGDAPPTLALARGQDEPLGDANWAPPPHLEGATPIAEPKSTRDSPRVVCQEAEGPLDQAVGMEEALPVPQGELAVEGDSPAEPASQQAEPADDFPPAEGPAPEDPSSSPSGDVAESEGVAALADDLPAAVEDCDGTPGPPAMTHGNGRWAAARPDRAPLVMLSEKYQSC